MFDLDSLSDITDHEAQIGDVRFFLDKMGAMEGWQVLERIRTELGRVAGISIDTLRGVGPGDEVVTGGAMFRAVLSLSEGFLERLRADLARHTRFAGNGAKTPQMLHGAEDMAFNGLEPMAVYEVLVRGLAVNFSASFAGLAGMISRTAPPTTPQPKRG